jgi:glycerol kinase
MGQYILALDQGTGSSRAILFDKKGRVVNTKQKEISQCYPKENWVEQNPIEIFDSQISVINDVLKDSKIEAKDIHSIGITNQRETTIIWDKKTGTPIYNAIVWQDQRTQKYCNQIKETKGDLIHSKTGLVVDPYFSASKIRWILEHIEGAPEKAEQEDLLFGTVDTWLIWKLTKGQSHITDVSNASRTMLFDINTLSWDSSLLDVFEIPNSILPNIVDSSGDLAKCNPDFFGVEIPITGIAGDQQAALFGQKAFNKGMVKNTYGTGCFMLMNIGNNVALSKNGLLTTVAWRFNGQCFYALEGSVFIAGAASKWLRDQLMLIDNVAETETLAKSVNDNGGVYIVPAFSGLGAPFWNADANGTVVGLKLSTSKAHIVRATLESIAYRTKDILDLMEKDSNTKISSLSADGGAANNQFLMQFQSDMLNINVSVPKQSEITALGAAFLSGLGSQFWSLEKIENIKNDIILYHPNISDKRRNILYQNWQNVVRHLLELKITDLDA